MPAGATWLNQDKPRPFALAARSSPGALATLVYGSTQETEKRSGAATIAISPIREGLNRNGLRAKTYFYPGTLLPVQHEDLPPHAGFLGKSLDALRAALRIALGIGQGSCRGSRALAGSRRGRIVVLSAALAREIHTAVAVVLTEPRYSREKCYQIILPVYSGPPEEAGEHQVVISSAPWLAELFTPNGGVTLPIPATHSVWYADDIARETEHVLDERTLADIDRRLCAYFSLPE
jgi:hypothetical protein